MVREKSNGRVAHFALGLAVLLVVFLLGACTTPAPAESEKGEAAAEGPAPVTLLPPEASAPAELPAALTGHLQSMLVIAKPLTEHCEMQSRDLNDYFDLVQAEFEAGAAAEFSAEERATLKAAYMALSTASARCLNNEAGRRFSQRLLAKVRPLTE